MHMILANHQEAEKIDGLGFNWTPHRNKVPCYPGFLDATSSPWFICQCYDADPYIGNGILTGRNKLNEAFGVVDFDDIALYEAFISRVRIDTSVALTRRGAHVYVRGQMPNRIRIGKQPIDLISERKFVAAPLSDGPTSEFQRAWLHPLRPVHQLAEFDPAWFERKETASQITQLVSNPSSLPPSMQRVESYLDRAEPAISGQNGHGKFFGVCTRTLRVFQWLTFDQFVRAMTYYSARCQPPWSDREILHKCESAWEKERGQR